jgi:hypothetical protein
MSDDRSPGFGFGRHFSEIEFGPKKWDTEVQFYVPATVVHFAKKIGHEKRKKKMLKKTLLTDPEKKLVPDAFVRFSGVHKFQR